jgi:hypothetical protein
LATQLSTANGWVCMVLLQAGLLRSQATLNGLECNVEVAALAQESFPDLVLWPGILIDSSAIVLVTHDIHLSRVMRI